MCAQVRVTVRVWQQEASKAYSDTMSNSTNTVRALKHSSACTCARASSSHRCCPACSRHTTGATLSPACHPGALVVSLLAASVCVCFLRPTVSLVGVGASLTVQDGGD